MVILVFTLTTGQFGARDPRQCVFLDFHVTEQKECPYTQYATNEAVRYCHLDSGINAVIKNHAG